MKRFVSRGVRFVRRIVIAVVGTTVLLGGLALLVLPGPAFIVVPIGLGILALEFAWARRWLTLARDYYAANTATIDRGEAGEGLAEEPAGAAGQGAPPDRDRASTRLGD